MIAYKYKWNETQWWPSMNGSRRKDIEIMKSILISEEWYRVSVGCGDKTHFWKDRLLVDSPFCLEFPRLFRIVTAKDSFVCQCWSDSLYAWDIKFRRNFTDAEFDDGVALLNKLQTFRLNNRDDVYVWCWKMIAPSQTNRSPPSSL